MQQRFNDSHTLDTVNSDMPAALGFPSSPFAPSSPPPTPFPISPIAQQTMSARQTAAENARLSSVYGFAFGHAAVAVTLRKPSGHLTRRKPTFEIAQSRR